MLERGLITQAEFDRRMRLMEACISRILKAERGEDGPDELDEAPEPQQLEQPAETTGQTYERAMTRGRRAFNSSEVRKRYRDGQSVLMIATYFGCSERRVQDAVLTPRRA